LKAQLNSGRDLLEAVIATKGYNHGYDWIGYKGGLSDKEVALVRRNAEEAIRAFETALLLDPNNREAKFQLAACFQKPFIHRVDEARELYREIIEELVDDRWTGEAQRELAWGLEERSSAEEAARWFQSALARNTNKSRTEFFRQRAETAANAIIIQRGDSPQATELAQKRLLERIRLNREFIKNSSGSFHPDYGMDDFAEAFKHDKDATARALVEFLPKMKGEYPDMIPYLLASVLDSQTEANGLIATEFERVLDDCIKTPGRVFKPEKFWQDVRWKVYGWCFSKTNYGLAVKLMEGQRSAAVGGFVSEFKDQDKIKLGYAYMSAGQWKDALETFGSFSNRQFRAEGGGPWGKAFVPILTRNLANDCRSKLGLAIDRDPREFDIGPDVVCLHEVSDFACDADGLWLAIAGQLIQCNFDLKTNRIVNLPIDPGTPISCLSLGAEKIWIGTSGEGLVEYDKTTHACRHHTEADGLMMDNLTSLHVAGDVLWIGYGGKNGGGLGQLDLKTGKFKSYMASLTASTSIAPPKTAVGNITSIKGDEVWLTAKSVAWQFHPTTDSWGTLPNKGGQFVTCLTADSHWVVQGVGIGQNEVVIETRIAGTSKTNLPTKTKLIVTSEEERSLRASFKTNGGLQRISGSSSGGVRPKGGLEIRASLEDKWQSVVELDGLPNPPTVMALDGDALWIGGEGFITQVDLKECMVRKFCHIRARAVDRIQVGGGYVWVKFDKHLHRAALRELR
jgi:tetratricopeptide (TPR) repeat protein